jgi:hypothetical protein
MEKPRAEGQGFSGSIEGTSDGRETVTADYVTGGLHYQVWGRQYAWNDGSRKRHGGHNGRDDRDHKHFVRRHRDDFDHRFVAVGVGWWPGYYSYGYGYGGCEWLRRQALYTGSPYWWNRYYACTGYDYY